MMEVISDSEDGTTMEITATVTAIGPHAISQTDPLVILFGKDATPELADVSVIQQFDEPSQQKQLALHHGDHIFINDIKFRVSEVGSLTNANLQQIGHATLMFQPVPSEDRLGNAVYLVPTARPTFTIGTTIRYVMQD
ncbi:hypothetical protein FC50_GL002272 [Lacticaseibacillus pantheris DSM 15945 = JCM 12539 = NBRC 106106]|jgi:PTS system glucitol/sorbitol-specific IIA component|uniref:Uncharacterized protein n=2 Tax=Lacticaseibacillus pantheris TaxID=171523 RepID=A0A0R1U4B9_9LACO|nr:hypothetical protein FC50_GL002272 [Lacticaseibacillus pantheris DSM 15945 = JCM 12539 = NBRC 106106]